LSDHSKTFGPLRFLIHSGIFFLKRQQRDWKVTVLRTSLDKLAYQMVFPYLSIYIVALGASGTQLGIVNSIGMIIAAIGGPFTGWFIDRIGPQFIIIFFVAIDLLVRLPLLISIPETLHIRLQPIPDRNPDT